MQRQIMNRHPCCPFDVIISSALHNKEYYLHFNIFKIRFNGNNMNAILNNE